MEMLWGMFLFLLKSLAAPFALLVLFVLFGADALAGWWYSKKTYGKNKYD